MIGSSLEDALPSNGSKTLARPELTPQEIEDFRDALCTAALELLAEGGSDAVTMRALARRVGCSHTTPYRYFESKQAIIAAVQARCFEDFADFHESRLEPEMSAEKRFHVLARGYLDYAHENSAAFRVMFDLDGDHEQTSEELKSAIQRSWNILSDTVKRGIEEGLLEGKIRQTTFILWSSLHGMTALNQAGKLAEGVASTMLDPLVRALIRAHAPRQ